MWVPGKVFFPTALTTQAPAVRPTTVSNNAIQQKNALTKRDSINFLDLFAGAGGLSEGFIRADYSPVAHVEINRAACFTLRTRLAYHWLKDNNRLDVYNSYLRGEITRSKFYSLVPKNIISSVINAEIGEDTLNEIFKRIDTILDGQPLDLIVGGPPCQAYSIVGRARDKNSMRNDKRNYLFVYYAKFLEKYQPQYFVFENVTGLLSAKSPEGLLYLESMRNVFRDVGYETEYRTLSADDYGVLQSRRRVIIVGRRGSATGFFPELQKWIPKVTVNEVLKDLPPIPAGGGRIEPCHLNSYNGVYLHAACIKNNDVPVTYHIARPHTEQDKEIYRLVVEKWNDKQERIHYSDLPNYLQTHKNKTSFTDRFKVVAGDLQAAQTVVAHIAKDGHHYIHPDIEQNRSLTPREAARLQTFPDDFYFETTLEKPGRTPAFAQIGNAVPVLLAEEIADSLLHQWE